MRLTNEQSWQAAHKFLTPNGHYMDLPSMGMFTPDEVKEGIEQEHLIFSFKNGCVYICLGSEEDISYRQLGKRRIAIPGLNPEKAIAWIERIHPSINRETTWYKETKATAEDFDEWLEERKKDPVGAEAFAQQFTSEFTPIGEVLEQKELL